MVHHRDGDTSVGEEPSPPCTLAAPVPAPLSVLLSFRAQRGISFVIARSPRPGTALSPPVIPSAARNLIRHRSQPPSPGASYAEHDPLACTLAAPVPGASYVEHDPAWYATETVAGSLMREPAPYARSPRPRGRLV